MSVEHQTQQQRFCILEAGNEAELTYELSTPGRVNFIRTYVPFKLRGKGYAEQLVRCGLQWAEANQLQVDTCCWYVEKFIDQ